MNFKQTIFSIRGLTCQIMVNDGNENSNYSNFFKFWNGTLTLNYSMYLIFNINLDADGKVKKKGHVKSEDDIYESCIFSFFDMFKVKKVAKKLLEDLSSEYYTMEDHVERGLIPTVKPEFKKYLATLTNSTKTNQIGFRPKFVYDRKNDEYLPVVLVIINRDDVGVRIPLDSFLSIMQYILDLNLHDSAVALINASLANKALIKRNTTTTINNTEVE